MRERIGFMQGRLCDLVNGKIQSFPWIDWESEFSAAAAIDFHLMEWTLDQENLHLNPLMTEAGQEKIKALCIEHDLIIPSLTGDCFMQAPFWKANGRVQLDLQSDFLAVATACSIVGIRMMVIPLVDNGKLDSFAQEDVLVDFLLNQQTFFKNHNLKVIFESDFSPLDLSRFISRLPHGIFGINYDMGNSSALGFNPIDEFSAYGSRIVNVHIKDRLLGGTTVPLGTGNANFSSVFSELAKVKYRGNYILQTARAADGSHANALSMYRDMSLNWIESHAA
jgi:hexulose-6-phosphate isomerase